MLKIRYGNSAAATERFYETKASISNKQRDTTNYLSNNFNFCKIGTEVHALHSNFGLLSGVDIN